MAGQITANWRDHGQVAIATIKVSDLAEAQRAYCDELGYVVAAGEPVSPALATLWGEEALTGRSSCLLQPESGARVYIRLVEIGQSGSGTISQDAAAVQKVDRGDSGAGWFSIEICVEDSQRLYTQLLDSEYFEPFAPPAPLPFTDKILPMQCRGLNGEILYLNEVRGSLDDVDLPVAKSFVDHIFIAVLGTSDIDASTEFYERELTLSVQEKHVLPYKTINRVFGLPLDTKHTLYTLGQGRRVTLELDQLPAKALKPGRASSTGNASGDGLYSVGFLTTRPADSQTSSNALENRAALIERPYDGRTVACLAGPDGERVEIIHVAS